MPTLTFPGMPATTKATLPAPEILPGVDLATHAETSWLVTQVDARNVIEAITRARALDERVTRGYDWLAAHPDDRKAQTHLFRLQDRCSEQYARARMWMLACWTHCLETYGFRRNAGLPSSEPAEIWNEAGLGELSPPGVWPPAEGEHLNWIEARRSAIGAWEIPEYQRLLDTVRTHAGGGEGQG